MSERKQSLNEDQVVSRKHQKSFPVAGSPAIADFDYVGDPAEQIGTSEDDVSPVGTLPAPRNVEIVSQTIRFAPDGTQYVTVVVEFDEVPAATGYEYRISKL